MKKTIIILLSVVLIISLLAGCSYFYNSNENTTMTTKAATTKAPTTSKPTTTKPTTTKPAISRDDVMPDEPNFVCTMNSVGGIDLLFEAPYRGKKDIKYYTITLHLYNSVDDEVYDDIMHKSELVYRVSGPVSPGQKILLGGDALFYAKACTRVQIDYIEFEYMDGTTDKFWYGWYTGVGYGY